MNSSFRFSTGGDSSLRVLWEDDERVVCRGWRLDPDGQRMAVLAVWPAAEHPTPASLDRLSHEYGLKDELDGIWALRPLELRRESGRTVLVLEDPGGEPLAALPGGPMEAGYFLRLAIGISSALGQVHKRGLAHKDLKPAHIVVTHGATRCGSLASASPRACRAADRRPIRPSRLRGRSPTWRPNRPDA